MLVSTELNQIEIVVNNNNALQLRFHLIVSNNGADVSRQNHRCVIEMNGDIDGTIAAVNANLAQMGYPAVSQADVDKIKAQAAVAWV